MNTALKTKLGFLLGILLIATLIVTSCTSAPATPDVASPDEAEEGSIEVQATEEEMGEEHEPVTIRFYEWVGSPQNETHETLINNFMEEYPWITVELQVVPFGEFYSTLTAQIAAGNMPDVTAANLPEVTNYAYNGLLMPLVPAAYTSDEAQELLDDLLPSIADQCTFEEQLYCVAVKNSAVAMYYNADMVAAAGIEPPTTLEEGWTMDEARDVWLQLTDRPSPDAPPTVWGLLGRGGGRFAQGPYHGIGYIRSAGEPGSPTYMGMSEDGLSIDGYINTPEAIAAFQFIQDLHQVDKVVPLDVIQAGFETGQAAFYEFPEQLTAVLDSQYPDINYGVMPLPYFKTGFTHDGSFAYVIAATTEHPEESGMLVKFLANPENSLYFQQQNASLPVRKSVMEEITDYDALPKKIFMDEMVNWGQGRQNSPAYSEYSEVVFSGIQDILLGAPVEDRVAQMVADFDAAVASYK
jgi:ABC-type glycerol-3-phosphate transport system substrate-binding protein